MPTRWIDQYITELYLLADNCEFEEKKDDMIRDRLVVGIKDSTLSERLQLDSGLTLEAAKTMIRQREAVHLQQTQLKGDEDKVVEETAMKRGTAGRRYKYNGHRNSYQSGSTRTTSTCHQTQQCKRCGKGTHPKERCPAIGVKWIKCNRKGHYGRLCLSKTVADMDSQSLLDTAFLNLVSNTSDPTAWEIQIKLNGINIPLKLDTGAEPSAISDATFTQKLKRHKLKKPSRALLGPSRRSLNVIGQFNVTLQHGTVETFQTVYVVKELKKNLLGLPAIVDLNFLTRAYVDTITTDIRAEHLTRKFPSLFTGLGNLWDEYEIQLKPGSKPHALYTARHVALPLRPKVQEELARMEKLGVISRVTQPTEWCAGMVIIPKPNKKVWICVDGTIASNERFINYPVLIIH